MENQLRPLGIVKEIIEEAGHEITYAYDDLVFIEHNDFLLQFAPEPNRLNLFFNTECTAEEADAITARLLEAAGLRKLSIMRNGTYTMTEAENDNLQITFNP